MSFIPTYVNSRSASRKGKERVHPHGPLGPTVVSTPVDSSTPIGSRPPLPDNSITSQTRLAPIDVDSLSDGEVMEVDEVEGILPPPGETPVVDTDRLFILPGSYQCIPFNLH
jgi:hypothetical protein